MSATTPMPAVSLAAVPGRRQATLEMARQIEQRGFSGIYCPSLADNLSLCAALALVTRDIEFGTSITPIYTRNVVDFAQTAAFIHETSGGRFRFGVGVSHEPAMARIGVTQGKPLADMRRFVEDLKAVPRVGELPPIVLAALRDRMIGHMIPTCISDDVDAAMAVNRRTLTSYAYLPNYRNYWREAGYGDEMDDVERAIEAGDQDAVGRALSDRWLADTTLFGPAARIREGIDAWFEAGIRTPIIVPSAVDGGQMKALEQFFRIWD